MRIRPKFAKVNSKFRGRSKPSRDSSKIMRGAKASLIREVNRKMIGKRRKTRVRNLEIGGVVSNRDRGNSNRVVREKRREKKTIKARRPTIRRRRRISDVIKGMGNRRRIKERKLLFKERPRRKKRRRGQMSTGGGRIMKVFYKVQITAEKSSRTIKDRRHSIKKKSVEDIISRFEVDVEKLKGLMRVGFRSITTKLDVTTGDRRKKNIFRNKEVKNRRRVNNKSARATHVEIVPRNRTI
jgi:hypothetical protein